MPSIRRFILFASVLASFSVVEIASAQPFGTGMRGWGSSQDVMGPGTIVGPGMMRYGRVDLMCSPASAGFVGWRIDRLELSIKPTEAQRGKFDELKTASNKASEAMRVACPTDAPTTSPERMAAMEKRLDAMLQASRPSGPRSTPFTPHSATSKRRASMLLLAGCASGENSGSAVLVQQRSSMLKDIAVHLQVDWPGRVDRVRGFDCAPV